MHTSSDTKRTTHNINGVLLLNKPRGCTSQQVVSRVKRLFNIKKAGHTGSLDPIATGLLPICLGEATKFSQYLLAADKHYRVNAKLGQRTNTGDTEGTVIEQKQVPLFTDTQLHTVLSRFKGHIEQIPPIFSALKHQGKPLYAWARQGIHVERNARPVTIHSLTLLAYTKDYLSLEVRCSKGTYIRSLIDDIGVALDCGAHVIDLYRLSVGQYSDKNSITLEALEMLETPEKRMETLLPLEAVLPTTWPCFKVSDPAAFYLKRGQSILLPNTPQTDWVRLVLKSDNSLLGIGQILKDGRIKPHRLINEA